MTTPIEAGPELCKLYPTGKDTSTLAQPFRSRVQAFIFDLEGRGCHVKINATSRPRMRAWLMRQAWDVAHGVTAPEDVAPAPDGTAIRWTLAGAKAMCATYRLAYRPSLTSRHIPVSEGAGALAIDMTISGWKGTRAELDALGRSHGVHPLAGDPPHWSVDGR